jgi:hypothetical protein
LWPVPARTSRKPAMRAYSGRRWSSTMWKARSSPCLNTCGAA